MLFDMLFRIIIHLLHVFLICLFYFITLSIIASPWTKVVLTFCFCALFATLADGVPLLGPLSFCCSALLIFPQKFAYKFPFDVFNSL